MKRLLARFAVPILLLGLLAGAAAAQELVFQIDPAQSKVEFTLGDVMHTVHGTFRLKPSTIQFDPKTGAATGTFIVDATSGDSGSEGRDRKMHKDVLESAKYPEIRFAVRQFQGMMPASGTAQVQLAGVMTLHGGDHPMTVSAPVQVANGRAAADVHFIVPYVQWGLKNPSVLFLRVSDKVEIVVHAVGTIVPAAPPAATRH
jgi:polyisoprenoid-binding protein YceI